MKESSKSWLVIRDNWIPDRQFDLGQERERDSYISYCRANYEGCYSYILEDNEEYIRGVMRAAGFACPNKFKSYC